MKENVKSHEDAATLAGSPGVIGAENYVFSKFWRGVLAVVPAMSRCQRGQLQMEISLMKIEVHYGAMQMEQLQTSLMKTKGQHQKISDGTWMVQSVL